MRIHNLYVDDQGETHFRDIEVEWTREGPGGKLSATQAAKGIIFRETPGSYDYDWHPAPRRQYIINLDAGVRITVSDGEVREIGADPRRLFLRTFAEGHQPPEGEEDGDLLLHGRRAAGDDGRGHEFVGGAREEHDRDFVGR